MTTQPTRPVARDDFPSSRAAGWSLRDQQGQTWALLEQRPDFRGSGMPGVVLVEGAVSA